jgi:hypothetical protein
MTQEDTQKLAELYALHTRFQTELPYCRNEAKDRVTERLKDLEAEIDKLENSKPSGI